MKINILTQISKKTPHTRTHYHYEFGHLNNTLLLEYKSHDLN